jgi:GcrA cell cycle regulator
MSDDRAALKAEIANLFKAGQSYDAIAAKMGVTRNVVAGVLSRLGIKRPPKKSPPEKNAPQRRKPVSHHAKSLKGMVKMKPVSKWLDVGSMPPPAPDTPSSDGRPRLHELQPGQCHYPYGDRSYTFCAVPTEGGGVWCPDHRKLVYKPSAAILAAMPNTNKEND